MNLFYQPLLPQGIHYLDEEESRHCVKVLRRRNGDPIRITDGAGNFYEAVIVDANPAKCVFSVRETTSSTPPTHSIHIAIAPTKNPDRIEWFVEKVTELGIDKISLITTEHTEKSFIKRERLVKMAISAMKQSLKARLPVISELITFASCLEGTAEAQRFIAHVDQQNPLQLLHAAKPQLSTLVLIGPEGDFSREEVAMATDHGFVKVGLGKSRLRTETAGVAACHILNLVNS